MSDTLNDSQINNDSEINLKNLNEKLHIYTTLYEDQLQYYKNFQLNTESMIKKNYSEFLFTFYYEKLENNVTRIFIGLDNQNNLYKIKLSDIIDEIYIIVTFESDNKEEYKKIYSYKNNANCFEDLEKNNRINVDIFELTMQNIINIKYNIKFKNISNLYKPIESLRNILGEELDTLNNIYFKLFKIFTKNNLIQEDMIIFNETFQNYFFIDKLPINKFGNYLRDFLLPPDIFRIEKDLKNITEDSMDCFEIKLCVDDVLNKQKEPIILEDLLNKEIKINKHIKDIKTKIEKLELFIKSPTEFVKLFFLKDLKEFNIEDIFLNDKFFYDENVQKIIYNLMKRMT